MSHWQGISCKRYLHRERNRERFFWFFFKGLDFFLKVHRMSIFPADSSWHRDLSRAFEIIAALTPNTTLWRNQAGLCGHCAAGRVSHNQPNRTLMVRSVVLQTFVFSVFMTFYVIRNVRISGSKVRGTLTILSSKLNKAAPFIWCMCH